MCCEEEGLPLLTLSKVPPSPYVAISLSKQRASQHKYLLRIRLFHLLFHQKVFKLRLGLTINIYQTKYVRKLLPDYTLPTAEASPVPTHGHS